MRFLDANMFICAHYKLRKPLTQKEEQMKEQAKRTITKISEGKEQVTTTVVHLSETVTILKHGMPQEQLIGFIRGRYMVDSITIHGVSPEACFAATELGDGPKLEANNALTVDIMKQNRITEIYAFDEDFDDAEGITRLPRP